MNDIYKMVGIKRKFFGHALHNHNPHSLIALVGQSVKMDDPEANKLMLEQSKQVIAECGKRGYGEYRAPTHLMTEASDAYDFNNNALLRFYETIKTALDPNGILSPGKNGINTKNQRGNQV